MTCTMDLDGIVGADAKRAALAVLERHLPAEAVPRTAFDRCRWEDILAEVAEALGFWRVEEARERAAAAEDRLIEQDRELRDIQGLADERWQEMQALQRELARARDEIAERGVRP